MDSFPPSRRPSIILLILGLLISLCLGDLSQTYCSDENTGSGNHADSTIYESLGNCQTKCKPNFAFAVVQGHDCWCSNHIPSNQLSVSKCSDKCLGYPFESCGNAGASLYGYLALEKQPSGTASTGVPASSTPILPPSASTPMTIQSLKTVGGNVITATVTVMPTGASSSDAENKPGKTKMSSGSVVAIAVAVVIACVVLLSALIIGWCCWRRKRTSSYATGDNGAFPQRNTSTLSKAGLLGRGSSTNAVDPYFKDPSPTSERRNSKPLVIDQRLNPNALMVHDDGSRSSFVSMQDNRDYTRTLNVRNPDPAHNA